MKRHEIQKPLVQSALVLVAVFILIGFVAGSNAHSISGGIASIFKGAFFTILFAVALIFSLVLSVVILIAIFLGAVALYSPDSSREMYYRLRERAASLYCSWSTCKSEKCQTESSQKETEIPPLTSPDRVEPQDVSQPEAQSISEEVRPDAAAELSEEIGSLREDLKKLQENNNSLVSSIEEIKEQVSALPVEITLQKTEQIEIQQADLTSAVDEFNSKIEAVSSASKNNGQLISQHSATLEKIDKKIEGYVKDLSDITSQIKTADSEEDTKQETETSEEHRIFSYFENQEDKKRLSELIEEAVSKELTYAEIDDFLTESLPKELDTIIKEHPSLTKEYIRDCRKK